MWIYVVFRNQSSSHEARVYFCISQRNLGQHFNLPSGAETRPRIAQKVDFCRGSTVGSVKIASWVQIRRWFSLCASFLLDVLKMGSAWKKLQSLAPPISLHDHRECTIKPHVWGSDLPEEEKWSNQGGEEERAVFICVKQEEESRLCVK